jgi:hypothetical protein
MGGKNYIPRKDAEFGPWAHNFITYAKANATRLGIPTLEFAVLEAYVANWDTDYAKAVAANHTTADVVQKNETREALETGIRAFVNQFIRGNPAVTEVDLANLGLPARDPHHTPVPPPSTIPEAEVKVPHPMVVEIHFRDEGSAKRGKPEGVQGAKIVYDLLDAPPATVKELTQSAFDPRSPFTLTFEENQRGKALYFALRWENAKGQVGHWSVIQKAIIP